MRNVGHIQIEEHPINKSFVLFRNVKVKKNKERLQICSRVMASKEHDNYGALLGLLENFKYGL